MAIPDSKVCPSSPLDAQAAIGRSSRTQSLVSEETRSCVPSSPSVYSTDTMASPLALQNVQQHSSTMCSFESNDSANGPRRFSAETPPPPPTSTHHKYISSRPPSLSLVGGVSPQQNTLEIGGLNLTRVDTASNAIVPEELPVSRNDRQPSHSSDSAPFSRASTDVFGSTSEPEVANAPHTRHVLPPRRSRAATHVSLPRGVATTELLSMPRTTTEVALIPSIQALLIDSESYLKRLEDLARVPKLNTATGETSYTYRCELALQSEKGNRPHVHYVTSTEGVHPARSVEEAVKLAREWATDTAFTATKEESPTVSVSSSSTRSPSISAETSISELISPSHEHQEAKQSVGGSHSSNSPTNVLRPRSLLDCPPLPRSQVAPKVAGVELLIEKFVELTKLTARMSLTLERVLAAHRNPSQEQSGEGKPEPSLHAPSGTIVASRAPHGQQQGTLHDGLIELIPDELGTPSTGVPLARTLPLAASRMRNHDPASPYNPKGARADDIHSGPLSHAATPLLSATARAANQIPGWTPVPISVAEMSVATPLLYGQKFARTPQLPPSGADRQSHFPPVTPTLLKSSLTSQPGRAAPPSATAAQGHPGLARQTSSEFAFLPVNSYESIRMLQGTTEVDEAGFAVIAEFEIIAELGRGNFGCVSLAVDADGKTFAVKTLHRGTHIRGKRPLPMPPPHTPAIASPSTQSSIRGGDIWSAGSPLRLRDGGAGSVESRRNTAVPSPERFPGSPSLSRLSKAPAVGSPLNLHTNSLGSRDDVAEREIAVMKRLHHPNIVKLHAVIEDPQEGQTHLVMQYIENGPVAKLKTDGTCKPISISLALHYMSQVAGGLEYLHRCGILHRDIKPENILIGKGHTAYLSDFGVSSMMAEKKGINQRVGTLPFLSPEIVNNASAVEEFGVEGDVWAFGVTLYSLVFGRLPFKGTTGPGTVRSICQDPLAFPLALPGISGRRASTDSNSTQSSKDQSIRDAAANPLASENSASRITPLEGPKPGGIPQAHSSAGLLSPSQLQVGSSGQDFVAIKELLAKLLCKDPRRRITLAQFRHDPLVQRFRHLSTGTAPSSVESGTGTAKDFGGSSTHHEKALSLTSSPSPSFGSMTHLPGIDLSRKEKEREMEDGSSVGVQHRAGEQEEHEQRILVPEPPPGTAEHTSSIRSSSSTSQANVVETIQRPTIMTLADFESPQLPPVQLEASQEDVDRAVTYVNVAFRRRNRPVNVSAETMRTVSHFVDKIRNQAAKARLMPQ